LEKKKEKMKNLERQALKKCHAKSRQKGKSEEDFPDEDDGNEGDDDSDGSEGMAACLDRILEDPPCADVDISWAGASKKSSGSARDGQQKEASPHRSRVETPPAPVRGQAASLPQPPPSSRAGHRVKTMATGPLTHDRAAMAASNQREGGRGSTSPGTRQVGGVEPRPVPAQEKPGVSTWGGSRPAGRGTGRRDVLPVRKDLHVVIFVSDVSCPCWFLFLLSYSSFF